MCDMKKIFTWMSLCLAVCFTACEYDDTDILNKLNEQEERLAALEKWQATTNNNITALQQLVNTMDYITSVSPIMQEKDTIGYTINFLKSNPVSIYNGKNGDTPQISIKQDTDQVWYWIVDGEWLKDANGNRVSANGREPITPQIMTGKSLAGKDVTTDAEGNKIVSDAIYLSVDGGKAWYRISGEKGDKGDTGATGPQGPSGSSGASGDSFFESVTIKDGYVIFKLKNGQQFDVPLYKGALTFALGGVELTDLTSPIDISSGDLTYTLSGEGETFNVSARIVEAESDSWTVSVVDKEFQVNGVQGENAVLEVVLTDNAKVVETYRLQLSQEDYHFLGSGTVEDPFLISSVGNLMDLAKWTNDGNKTVNKHFQLTTDLDLTGVAWTPIGETYEYDYTWDGTFFRGIFDGGGHTIRGLFIDNSSQVEYSTGLFSNVGNGGNVKNLILENPQVKGNIAVGALVGINWGNIENCHVKNVSISGTQYVGGLVGISFMNTIENCSVEGNVSSIQKGRVGGVIGGIEGEGEDNTRLIACRFSGTVNANASAGGVLGFAMYADIMACYSTGSVHCGVDNTVTSTSGHDYEKDPYPGGVAGFLSSADVNLSACYSTSSLSKEGNTGALGGITGARSASQTVSISTCYWKNNAEHGIGDVHSSDYPASDEGTTQITDNWDTALSAMNSVLAGAGYRYILNKGSDKEAFPLLIEKVQ